MSIKSIVFFVSALLIQSITSNCVPAGGVSSSSCSSGGAFLVQSSGPVSPRGLAATADAALSGNLALEGTLPFLSAVGFEGQFPSTGGATVNYSCGDGCVAIKEEIGGRVRN